MYGNRTRRLGVAALCWVLALPGALAYDGAGPVSRPLPPEYRLHADGSVTLRLCFNASCARRQRLTFTAADIAHVAGQLAVCPRAGVRDRLQRIRIAVWQMQVLAQKYQPLLGNDLAVNDREYGVQGRLDCVDSSSNTATYLGILAELGHLPGWTVARPRVRDWYDFNQVHWTAVVQDQASGELWAVDSWFRPNGNLPFVLPLADWKAARRGWEPPLDALNPYPRTSAELCPP
ncbi:MAG: hypothetical protein AB7Q97_06305 [Gammaproteobacteria bacterium]